MGVKIRLVHNKILHISALVSSSFTPQPMKFMHVLVHYLTDKFGSLGSLLYVRTVDYASVV